MTLPKKETAQRFFNAVATKKENEHQRYAEEEFYKAVSEGDIALVTQMLDACPAAVLWQEEDWRDNGDCTTGLMIAAAKGNIDMAQLLLARGAKPDQLDKGHGTALHQAAYHGHKDMAALLLRHGANADQVCYLSTFRLPVIAGTPFDIAVKKGWTDIAVLLHQKSAEKNPHAHALRKAKY